MDQQPKPIYIGTPAAPRQITDTGRPYVMDAAIRAAAERADKDQPKLHTISSNTSNFRFFED